MQSSSIIKRLLLVNASAASRLSSRLNSQRACISRTNRISYIRQYPGTLLVQPDGSTINIRHAEPRLIVRLPIDLSKLSEEEKLARLAKRKPKQKIVIEEQLEDSYSVDSYSHLWKK